MRFYVTGCKINVNSFYFIFIFAKYVKPQRRSASTSAKVYDVTTTRTRQMLPSQPHLTGTDDTNPLLNAATKRSKGKKSVCLF